MTSEWADYYQDHQTDWTNWLLHWPYLARIILAQPKKVLEFGCGPADHSVFLNRVLPRAKIYLLDGDKKIIQHLKKKFGQKFAGFGVSDLTNQKQMEEYFKKNGQFDLMYSQGLMEHFGPVEFRKVIRLLVSQTNKIIFSVPSNLYPTKDFGNERLRTKKELEKVLAKIPGIKFKVRPYFPDIGVRTKKIVVQKMKLGLFEKLKIYLVGSCHWLVVVRS